MLNNWPLPVNPVPPTAAVVVVGSNWLLLSNMQRSAPPLSFPCFDEVGTSVVCRPLNLQGRACVTAALALLLLVVVPHNQPRETSLPSLLLLRFVSDKELMWMRRPGNQSNLGLPSALAS